ncbi:hypothetical protein [Winogradskyella poriferorum]|uniref:hypothetical protein n=1 Tax=Winogradskyella poriferorum TaxID=307627 RepID=UPI003D64B67B
MDKPKEPFGRIKCNICDTQYEYEFEFDSIKAPYKESGILKYVCGVDLVKWNSTTEPYLVLVSKN